MDTSSTLGVSSSRATSSSTLERMVSIPPATSGECPRYPTRVHIVYYYIVCQVLRGGVVVRGLVKLPTRLHEYNNPCSRDAILSGI